MMHHYGYNTKKGRLRLFWETLILPINLTLCSIENGFVDSTQRISKIWKDHKVRQKIKLKQQADTWLKEKYGMLTFNDYQETARKTAVYPSNYKLTYPALGLVGEAGEVANKIKKIIRDGETKMPPDWKDQVASEIGDVLWYCAALASDLDISLGRIAGQNRAKLEERMQNNKIHGSGDKR
jgi:NTP pyrophosphatase (non-canonical NTP hydrolase)